MASIPTLPRVNGWRSADAAAVSFWPKPEPQSGLRLLRNDTKPNVNTDRVGAACSCCIQGKASGGWLPRHASACREPGRFAQFHGATVLLELVGIEYIRHASRPGFFVSW